jgi:hypothetical protein
VLAHNVELLVGFLKGARTTIIQPESELVTWAPRLIKLALSSPP